jgi:hypothetical protein
MDFFSALKGGFFLMKKPIQSTDSADTHSGNAVT